MKKIILLILICSFNFSCRKNIEIDRNGIFIRDGVKSEFVIKKITNNNSDDTHSFPYNYSTKEEVRLKIGGNGISVTYENGEKKYFFNRELIDLKENINFQNENQYYHWVKEKPADNKEYEVLPMEFENGYWYFIQDISFRGSNCYFKFYINNNGKFEYEDIEYIHLSPI